MESLGICPTPLHKTNIGGISRHEVAGSHVVDGEQEEFELSGHFMKLRAGSMLHTVWLLSWAKQVTATRTEGQVREAGRSAGAQGPRPVKKA